MTPSSHPPAAASRRTVWIAAIVCIALFLVFYALIGYSSGYGELIDGKVQFVRETLWTNMRADFKRDEGEWGFGYFVPFAVVGLFWFRRKEILSTQVKPAAISGGAILVLGFLLFWAGYRGEQKYFGYAAGQLLVLGGVLWFLGWPWFRKIFWLWALLGLMWPWRFLIGRISAPLQLAMAKLTTGFLNLIGVGAISNGSSVLTDSRDPVTGDFINMDIDVACSGMRSLFALVMIGLIFSFVRVRDEWKRWVLMACVPVVAVIGNFVRMLMLYGGSRAWGTEFAIGNRHEMSGYHLLAGLMVFVVALILLSILVEILNRGTRYFKSAKVVRRKVVTGDEVEGEES